MHTHRRAEERACIHLERQGFERYLPRYLAERSHARRRDWVARPLFPGYLFVRLDLERDRWRAVNSTVGVRSLVGGDNLPSAVPAGLIDEIQAREDDGGHVALDAGQAFRHGDRVRIVEGPFAELEGLFQGDSDERRVYVLLDLLGRTVRVEARCRAIAAA